MIWEGGGDIRPLPASIKTHGCVFLGGGGAMPLVDYVLKLGLGAKTKCTSPRDHQDERVNPPYRPSN